MQVPVHPSSQILTWVRYASTFTCSALAQALWGRGRRSLSGAAAQKRALTQRAAAASGASASRTADGMWLMLAIGLVEMCANTCYGLGFAYCGSALGT